MERRAREKRGGMKYLWGKEKEEQEETKDERKKEACREEERWKEVIVRKGGGQGNGKEGDEVRCKEERGKAEKEKKKATREGEEVACREEGR